MSFRSPGLDDVGLATALGVLIAVLAGAVAGAWFGLVVAAIGWTLHFLFVAEESLVALATLPAWLGAAAVAGTDAAWARVYRLSPGPAAAGRTVARAATADRPAPRYVVPVRYRLLLAAFAALPTGPADAAKRRIAGLPGRPADPGRRSPRGPEARSPGG